MLTPITDHEERAKEHVAGPFQAQGLYLLLQPISEEIQAVEDALWAIYNARFLADAEGDALDVLGAALEEPRTGDDDDNYRIRLALKIRANVSKGQSDDIADLLQIVGSTYVWVVSEIPGWLSVGQGSGEFPFDAGRLSPILKYALADGFFLRLCATPDSTLGQDLLWFRSADSAVSGGTWQSADGAVAGDPWPGTWVET